MYRIDLKKSIELLDKKPICSVLAIYLMHKPDTAYHISKIFGSLIKSGKWKVANTLDLANQNKVSQHLKLMSKLGIVLLDKTSSRNSKYYKINPHLLSTNYIKDEFKSGRYHMIASDITEQYLSMINRLTKIKNKEDEDNLINLKKKEALKEGKRIFSSDENQIRKNIMEMTSDTIKKLSHEYRRFVYETVIFHFIELIKEYKNTLGRCIYSTRIKQQPKSDNRFLDFNPILSDNFKKQVLESNEDFTQSIEDIVQSYEKLIIAIAYNRIV